MHHRLQQQLHLLSTRGRARRGRRRCRRRRERETTTYIQETTQRCLTHRESQCHYTTKFGFQIKTSNFLQSRCDNLNNKTCGSQKSQSFHKKFFFPDFCGTDRTLFSRQSLFNATNLLRAGRAEIVWNTLSYVLKSSLSSPGLLFTSLLVHSFVQLKVFTCNTALNNDNEQKVFQVLGPLFSWKAPTVWTDYTASAWQFRTQNFKDFLFIIIVMSCMWHKELDPMLPWTKSTHAKALVL